MEILLSTISNVIRNDDLITELAKELDILTPLGVDTFKSNLCRFLSTLNDDLLVVAETEYVDMVYRDTYYHYYATKIRNRRRNCARLSFFELVPKDVVLPDASSRLMYEDAYRGFLVLRPLAMQCIGRNVISPSVKKPSIGSNIKICQTPVNATGIGLKLNVNGFPHASQDGEMMTCAETSLWSVLYYFGNKYAHHVPLLPSELLKVMQNTSITRQIPSKGLSLQSMAYTLQHCRMGSVIYSNTDPYFKEMMSCYIESGIPLIVCLMDKSVRFLHAVVCVGRGDYNPEIETNPDSIVVSENGTQYYSWNKNVNCFVFNDDNMPCYQTAEFSQPTLHYGDPYNNAQIAYFIAPLHPHIYMTAEVASSFAVNFADVIMAAPEKSVIRTFLASSRTYTEYVMTNMEFSEDFKLLFLSLDLPRFVWITEISTNEQFKNNKANALIVMDATECNSNHENNPVLLYASTAEIARYNLTTHIFEKQVYVLQNEFSRFDNNIQ